MYGIKEDCAAIRAVETIDLMTARWTLLSNELAGHFFLMNY